MNITKYIWSFAFMLIGIFPSHGQSSLSKIQKDSLWGVWSNEKNSDTLRVEAMTRFIREGYLKKQPDSAIHYVEMQLVLTETKKLDRHKGMAILTKAAALQAKAKNPESETLIREALTILETKGRKPDIANALYQLASILEVQKKYQDAIIEYRKSLVLYEELGDEKAQGATLKDLAKNHYLREEYRMAAEYIQRSLVIREKLGNKLDIVVSLGILGNIYHNTGELDLAIGIFNRCVVILEELGNKQGIAINLNNVGNMYRRKGEYASALVAYEKSLSIKKEMGDKKGLAQTMNGIGVIHIMQGNLDKALEYLSQCETIFGELGDKEGVARTLLNTGKVLGDKLENERAMDYYQRSLALSEETGYKYGQTAALENIGILHDENGNTGLGLKILESNLELQDSIEDRNGAAMSHYNIGYLYRKLSDSARAAGNENAAKEFLQSALTHFYPAYAWQNAKGEKQTLKETCSAIHRTYRDLGRTDSAGRYLDLHQTQLNRLMSANFMTLSENEKQLYYATLEADYGYLYDFTHLQQTASPTLADRAFDAALFSKGISLRSSTAMRRSISESNDTALVNTYEKWISLKQKIAKAYGEGGDVRHLETRADELEKELIRRSELFSDFDKMKKLSWKDVKSSLGKKEAAIEFVHYQDYAIADLPIVYAAIIVKRDSEHPEFIRLCSEKDLQSLLTVKSGNGQDFANSIYGTSGKNKTDIYEAVWKPLEKSLKGIKRVYYSPSGYLHKISFSAISTKKDTYLCDALELFRSGSTSSLTLETSSKLESDDRHFLMGGVNYDTDSTGNPIWNYLPGTLAETEAIYSLLKQNAIPVEYFQKDVASEENFKSGISFAEVAHISTHGFFFPDPESSSEKENKVSVEKINFRGAGRSAGTGIMQNKNPMMRSGLVLAHANDVWNDHGSQTGEDGILTAQEVSTLDLTKMKLVVLSACETGLGDIKGSEGVYGLQRAFKMAGTKYIIMSLWQVPDEETSEFMQLFYKNLLKDKSVRTAFDKTQKTMRKKYDPFFWGAFVLIE